MAESHRTRAATVEGMDTVNLRTIALGLAGVGVLLIGAVWFLFIRSDAPPPASLGEAIAAVHNRTGG